MVDTPPLSLPEVTQAAAGDFYILELAAGGTRRISQSNAAPVVGTFATVLTAALDIDNDVIFVGDNTDGRQREVLLRNIIFGNYGNSEKDANFTLALGDAIQALEVDNVAVTTITLDGNASGIGGADFVIANFNNASITLASTNITMFVDGVASPNATIRARRSATITVNNASNEAIFSGG